MSNEPIVVRHTFQANVADVWHAISDDETMRQWFFEQIPGFAPVSELKRSLMCTTTARFTPTAGR